MSTPENVDPIIEETIPQWARRTSAAHADQWRRETIGYLITTPVDVYRQIRFFEALGMYTEAENVADENADLIKEWENWQ